MQQMGMATPTPSPAIIPSPLQPMVSCLYACSHNFSRVLYVILFSFLNHLLALFFLSFKKINSFLLISLLTAKNKSIYMRMLIASIFRLLPFVLLMFGSSFSLYFLKLIAIFEVPTSSPYFSYSFISEKYHRSYTGVRICHFCYFQKLAK